MIEENNIYLIEWIDSHSLYDNWSLIKDIKEEDMRVVKCHSIGYILKETKETMLIASHISDIENFKSKGAFTGEIVIPKISITKILLLKQ